MPLVGKPPLVRMRVRVCPGSRPADGAVILRLQNISQYPDGIRREERLGHEPDLVVHVGIPCLSDRKEQADEA